MTDQPVGSQRRTAIAICERYAAGDSIAFLAENYNLSEDTIALVLAAGAGHGATKIVVPQADERHCAARIERMFVDRLDPNKRESQSTETPGSGQKIIATDTNRCPWCDGTARPKQEYLDRPEETPDAHQDEDEG